MNSLGGRTYLYLTSSITLLLQCFHDGCTHSLSRALTVPLNLPAQVVQHNAFHRLHNGGGAEVLAG
jgi:hypothetical protein